MLFKDNTKILLYAAFAGTVDYAAILPTLRMIENDHLVKLIGEEQYAALDSALALITNEDSLSAAHKLLLHQCRMVTGPYLAYYYTPKAEVSLSATGATRSETTDSKTAYQNQVTKFRQANLAEAEKASELLLKFLERNKDNYPLWVASAAFASFKSLFITTAEDFNFQYQTASPYRNYWALRWKMKDVEDVQVCDAIGEDLFLDLKTKNSDATYSFTQKEAELINRLKKAIAYFTIAFALPEMTVRIDDAGITVADIASSTNDDNNRKDAGGDKLMHLIRNAQAAGRSWMERAVQYLQKNHTDFPLYEMPVTSIVSTGSGNENLRGSFGLI